MSLRCTVKSWEPFPSTEMNGPVLFFQDHQQNAAALHFTVLILLLLHNCCNNCCPVTDKRPQWYIKITTGFSSTSLLFLKISEGIFCVCFLPFFKSPPVVHPSHCLLKARIKKEIYHTNISWTTGLSPFKATNCFEERGGFSKIVG